MSEYWTSKLGNKFSKWDIQQNEPQAKMQLDHLRKLPGNRICADCGCGPTVWASVNLGIFLCIRCGSIHRGLGTHISKPKGCTGTYLWGADELEHMSSMGNMKSNGIYGGNGSRPSSDASDAAWRTFIANKYEQRLFMQTTTGNHDDEKPKQTICTTGDDDDLLTFDTDETVAVHRDETKTSNMVNMNASDDFFAQFGV